MKVEKFGKIIADEKGALVFHDFFFDHWENTPGSNSQAVYAIIDYILKAKNGGISLNSAAIAPPVAAGSVDTDITVTEKLMELCRDVENDKKDSYYVLQDYVRALIERAEKAEARVKELEAEIATDDRILRSSVPERWKGCASPVGAVQSYIAELEQLNPQNHYDLKA